MSKEQEAKDHVIGEIRPQFENEDNWGHILGLPMMARDVLVAHEWFCRGHMQEALAKIAHVQHGLSLAINALMAITTKSKDSEVSVKVPDTVPDWLNEEE